MSLRARAARLLLRYIVRRTDKLLAGSQPEVRTWTVEIPFECPECKARVCLGYQPGATYATLYCGSEHDDINTMCGWRQQIEIPPDVDQVMVESRWTSPGPAG